MKLLLDTHAFLWYISDDPKLPRYAYDAIRDKSNEVYLSVVSVWEALVKHKSGKLPLPPNADEYIDASRMLIESRTLHWIARLSRICFRYQLTIATLSIEC